MNYSKICFKAEHGVARITLSMPERRNALDNTMSGEIVHALRRVQTDAEVRVVVITGAGNSFCAGGDLDCFLTLDLLGSIEHVRADQALVHAFAETPVPIVTAVNGHAIGAGFSLALLGDMVLASDDAVFGAAFVHVGLAPDIGLLYLLPRLVGPQRAKELAFTGRTIDAQEALHMGIVNKVVPQSEFESAVQQLCDNLAQKPPLSLLWSKRLVDRSWEMSLDAFLELEAVAQGPCMQSAESRARIHAFLNRRKGEAQ